ncbi:hypothetical protein LENED_004652 [Lentinula edodes]|uniref:Uncharacterized protein n=1 Tax=Lentinula edodes TaxID=5353 RepID=A0A1Q3E6V4_LENED|nr:hypothetical protein LENED_004652 [Lentinula edodes]
MFMLCQLRFLHELMIGIHPMIIVNLELREYSTFLPSVAAPSVLRKKLPVENRSLALHNIGANNQNIPVIDEGISIEDGHPRLNRNSVRVNVLGKDTAVILKKIDELVDSGSWNDIPVMIMRGKGGKPLGMTAVYEQANKAQKKSLEEQVKKMTCDKVVSVAKKHQILNRGLEHLDILVTTSGSSVESVTLLTWNVYSIIGKDVPDGELTVCGYVFYF